MDFMSEIFSSVTRNFVGHSNNNTTSAGDDAEAEAETGISRSPRASPTNPHHSRRSPTARSRPPSIDLTTDSPPPSPQKRPATVSCPSDVRPAKKRRVSEDEQRLIPGSYESPADAIPIPDPITFYRGGRSNMNKPGAKYKFNPVSTGGRVTDYSKKGQPPVRKGKDLGWLDEDEPKHQNQPPPSPWGDAHSPKRRKTVYPIIDVDLEDDITDDHMEGYVHTQSSPRTAYMGSNGHSRPSSKRSTGSGNTANIRFTRQSVNEFQAASSIVDPRRKSARTRTPQSEYHGYEAASPIVVDRDTEFRDNPTARKLQLSAFEQAMLQQGENPNESKVISRHFQPGRPKTNQSTERVRTGLNQPPHQSQNDGNLRNKFRRTEPANEAISDDELVPEGMAKRRKPATKSVSKATFSQDEWPLKLARTFEFQGSGPDLMIKRGTVPNSWRLVEPGSDSLYHGRHEFVLKNIVRAEADIDSRIRLHGPRDANGSQYQIDLEFENIEQFKIFRFNVKSAMPDGRLVQKPSDYMRKIFEIPFPSSQPRVSSDRRSPQAQIGHNGDHVQQSNKRPSLLDGLHKPTSSSTIEADSRAPRPTRATRAIQPSHAEVKESPKKVFKHSVENGLGRPWRRQVTYGVGRRRAVIDFEDLVRLDYEEYLNDSLIDFYMIYLYNHRNPLRVTSDRVYFFSTHFFSTLTRKSPGQTLKNSINYSSVARWTAKEDIFNYDYIVVPINQDYHWYLAIICNVRNIARKPAVEDAGEASTRPEVLDKDSAPAVENVQSSTSTSSGITEIPTSTSADPDDNLFYEESNLDLIDPNGSRPGSNQTVIQENDLSDKSTTSEATKMEQLKLADSVPSAVQSESPSSPKKLKRKSGPPVKKRNLDDPCIIVLDSLGGLPKSGAVRALKNYINEEGKEKRGMDAVIEQNAVYAKFNQVPMQSNFYDCGVYLLGYVQKFFEDPDTFKNRLLQGEMQADTDWPEMSVPKMRDNMRTLLEDLHSKQDEEYRQKKTKKPGGTVTSTIQPQAASTNIEKQKAVVEDTVVPNPVPRTQSEESTRDEIVPTPRLGSPFKQQPGAKSNQAVSSPYRAAKTNASPGTPQGVQSISPSTGRRRSRQVVIPPTPGSARSRHPNDGTSPCVEVSSPEKQKKDHVGDYGPRWTHTVKEQPSPAPELAVSSSPKKPFSTSSATKIFCNDMRGSSSDPIPIEDSQDITTVELEKTPKQKLQPSLTESQDSVIVMSPKTISQQSIDAYPEVLQRRIRGGQHASRSRTGREEFGFIGDSLDSQLQQAQHEEYNAQRKAAGDDEWNVMMADDADEDDKRVIPETPSPKAPLSPPLRRTSAGGWSGSQPLPL